MSNFKAYPAYKNTKIAWLGDVPEHWDDILLNYIFNLNREKNKGDFEKNVLSLSYGNIISKKGKENFGLIPESFETYQIVKKGYLIFRFTDLQNDHKSLRVGYSNQDGIITSAYLGLKAKDSSIVPKYYYYFFHSLDTKKYFYSFGGGVRLSLDWSTLKKIKYPVPPKSEQTAIANFLDHKTAEIKAFIEQKEETIRLLKERKTAIINQAVTKGLDPNVEMKDSGVEWLGEIPAHWEVKKLKHLSSLYGRIGFRGYQTSDLVEESEGAITISPSNMKEGGMKYSKCTYLSWAKYHESPEIKISNNDILFVKTGSTYGKVAIVKDLPKEATINPQILVFKDIVVDNSFFYYSLLSSKIRMQIQKSVIGGTIPTISQTKIGNFIVSIPSLEEQKVISVYINSICIEIDLLISNAEKEIKLIKEYQQSLISEAVTGKIDVREYQFKN